MNDPNGQAGYSIGAILRAARGQCNCSRIAAARSDPWRAAADCGSPSARYRRFAIATVEKPTRSIMSDRSHGDGADRQPTRVTLFLFATGIENSYPTIQNGRVRRDQMEECGHYDQWQRDFELLGDLNIRFLRYGPPLHKTFLGPGPVRLGVHRSDVRLAEGARHHPHRRPVPFRRARLDRRLPEPGLSRRCLPSTPAPSRSASPGSSSTPRSTRCSSAPSSRPPSAGGTSN